MNDITIMIFISIVAGLLSSMNVWAQEYSHIRFHINDVYMATLMAGWMLILEALIMHGTNILAGIVLVVLSIYAIRNQLYVDDKQYLKGMIPHHSMAILQSDAILKKTNDPRIKKLATDIISAQTREISEINNILG